MNSFFLSKRKTFELLLLLVIDAVSFFLWGSIDFVILFSFGYIWNWAGSQESSLSVDQKKYRFSTLKTVFNLQRLVEKPIATAPYLVKMFARILPAGLFWWGVIVFNESQMPWWSVFLGSLTFELVLLEDRLLKKRVLPPLPTEDTLP